MMKTRFKKHTCTEKNCTHGNRSNSGNKIEFKERLSYKHIFNNMEVTMRIKTKMVKSDCLWETR